MSVTEEELRKRFSYHRPTQAQADIVFPRVRTSGQQLARLITELVPEGREQSLALTKVEEAVMWANAGIARANSVTGGNAPAEAATKTEALPDALQSEIDAFTKRYGSVQ